MPAFQPNPGSLNHCRVRVSISYFFDKQGAMVAGHASLINSDEACRHGREIEKCTNFSSLPA